MAESLHPAAPHHLPSFIAAPGETDVLMVVTVLVLTVGVMLFGVLFFRLHTLPERIAHKSKKIQFELVAILGLIALFTHMHIFWIAGLLLAIIDIPDFGTSLGRIAGSVEKIAETRVAATEAASQTTDGTVLPPAGDVTRPDVARQSELMGLASTKPEIAPARAKEPGHA